MSAYIFPALLAVAAVVALIDWRRGWYLAILIGVLQDPARKLTPGTPVIMTLSIVVVYAAVIFAAAPFLRRAAADLAQRYPQFPRLFTIFVFLVLIAVANGLLTFGLSQWKVPVLGLFIYSVPLPAFVLGYLFLRTEDDLLKFLTFYAVITSVALIAVPLEYLRVPSPILGTVALQQDWIRHLPGVQVRILSGTYRSPDIMAWHAAMLCIIGISMAVRRGMPKGWIWIAVSGWGFLAAILSGRRKMLYMIAVFGLLFLWQYRRRLNRVQLVSAAVLILTMWVIVDKLATGSEQAQAYTKGAKTSRVEIFQRLEGGMIETIRERGFLGAGLGAATQGARHVALRSEQLGWQEGGAGKLALELGVPGILFAIYTAILLIPAIRKLSKQREATGGVSLIRVALVGILAANIASFLVSHQPFSDGFLLLMNAFLAGALFGTARLPEAGGGRPVEVPVSQTPFARPAYSPRGVPQAARRFRSDVAP